MFIPPIKMFGTDRRPLMLSRLDRIMPSFSPSIFITSIADFNAPSMFNTSSACTQKGQVDFENMTTGCWATIALRQSKLAKSLHSMFALCFSLISTWLLNAFGFMENN